MAVLLCEVILLCSEHLDLVFDIQLAYLSHKEWINNCWTAKEKLGDVVQQHDYELKMLKERVTMTEDEKTAARIAALEERIASMTLSNALLA